jgi:hypothetical protein
MELTIDEIKAQYPDQWVLLANPILKLPIVNDLLANRLVKAIVLLASIDKRELAYRAKEVVADCEDTGLLYTGEVSKKRLFLL